MDNAALAERTLVCSLCLVECNNYVEALFHVIESHGVHVAICCEFCNRFFMDLSDLEGHLRIAHPKEFSCQICDLEFTTKRSLTKHQKIHAEFITLQKKLELKCSYCDLIFETSKALNRHRRTHKRKFYTCEICGSSHPSNELLEQHKLIHSAHKRCVY